VAAGRVTASRCRATIGGLGDASGPWRARDCFIGSTCWSDASQVSPRRCRPLSAPARR
jgi:hypothetical protein